MPQCEKLSVHGDEVRAELENLRIELPAIVGHRVEREDHATYVGKWAKEAEELSKGRPALPTESKGRVTKKKKKRAAKGKKRPPAMRTPIENPAAPLFATAQAQEISDEHRAALVEETEQNPEYGYASGGYMRHWVWPSQTLAPGEFEFGANTLHQSDWAGDADIPYDAEILPDAEPLPDEPWNAADSL